MASGKILDKYGEFVVIDNLVKNYAGVYNHDDIFNMEVTMVHNMILLQKDLAYIQDRTQELQKQS